VEDVHENFDPALAVNFTLDGAPQSFKRTLFDPDLVARPDLWLGLDESLVIGLLPEKDDDGIVQGGGHIAASHDPLDPTGPLDVVVLVRDCELCEDVARKKGLNRLPQFVVSESNLANLGEEDKDVLVFELLAGKVFSARFCIDDIPLFGGFVD